MARKPAKSSRKPAAKQAPRLFGTDGVRNVAGQGPLTPESVQAIGRALGRYLSEHAKKGARPRVLVGVDPRPSADMLGLALAAGLVAESCDVQWPGMMSTPEVAFLTGHGPYAAGISVTASHNEAVDNGIKMFGHDGRKLPETIERKLEAAIAAGKCLGDARPRGRRFGWFQVARERNYEEFIVRTFRKSFATLKQRRLSIVFDMASGARSIDIQVLSRLAHSMAFGRTVPEFKVGSALVTAEAADNALDMVIMNGASPTQPESHDMINAGCGSLHPEGCARTVRELGADIGVCFDGDGDRCILVDEQGVVRDGDHMLYLLAADMKEGGELKNNLVVGTSMANLGLEVALGEAGIKFLRTDVGDKYVSEAMTKKGAVLGGEQSGHVIISDEGHSAGDGLYTALRVIEVMLDSGRKLSELCAPVRKFPQSISNVRTPRKPPLAGLKTLSKLTAELARKLGARGRINVRYSGTEPLLRIMVEAENAATLKQVSGALVAAAKKDLKV